MPNRQAFLHPIGAGKFSPGKLPGNILWLDSRQQYVTTNGARSFNGSTQRLISLGSSPFKPLGNSFWLSCWFYNNASQNNANRGLINKWGSSSLEEYLAKINTSNIVQWFVKDQDLNPHFVTSQNQVVAGRWQFLFTYWDADNRKIGMYFSEDRAYSEVAAEKMEQVNPAGTLTFKVGLSTSGAEFFQGNICQIALGIVPSSTVFAEVRDDILTTMYNSGNPFSVAALTSQQLADWGSEQTRWEMNERSGDALSAFDGSTNNLSDNGGVGEAAGPPNGLAINTNAKNVLPSLVTSPESNLVPRVLVDASTAGNDAILRGDTDPSRRYLAETPEVPNLGRYSMKFNGVDDLAETPLLLNDTQDYTVSFWFDAPPSGASYGTICGDKTSAGHGQAVFWGNSPITSEADAITFWPTTATIERVTYADPALAIGWHLVTCTFEAGTQQINLYIDGQLRDTFTLTVSPINAAPPVWIGTNATTYVNDFFNGVLSDFRIYQRVLSLAEHQALFAGTNPSDSGLVLHYDGDAGPDLTAEVAVTTGDVNDAWNWNGQHQQPHSSDMIDGSGNGVSLVRTNEPAWRTSRYVKTGQLSHEQRHICQYTATAPVPGLNLNGDCSFACWIKMDLGFVSTGWSGIQYAGEGFPYNNDLNGLALVCDGGGSVPQRFRRPRAIFGDGAVAIEADWPLWDTIGGDWVHLAVTINRSSNEMIIYLDGVAVTTPFDISTVGTVTGTVYPYSIGYSGVNNTRSHWWQDQSLVYNRTLSPAEITALAAGGSPPGSGLVAHHAADFDLGGQVSTPAWAFQGSKPDQRRITFPAGPVVPARAFELQLDYKVDGAGSTEYLLANGGETGSRYGVLIYKHTDPTMACWVSYPGWGRWIASWERTEVGIWAHLRVTFDGTTLLVYQNGDLAATGVLDDQATVGTSQNDLAIGNASQSLTSGLNGQIRNLVVKDGQGRMIGTWAINEGPNLPQVLQPADGSQDQQWIGDPLQTWAYKGNGSTPPEVIDHDSFAQTRTLQVTADSDKSGSNNHGYLTVKATGSETEAGVNLNHHSGGKISGLFANGTSQLQVFSTDAAVGIVNVAAKLEFDDSYLITDGDKVASGISGVIAGKRFRLADYYTDSSFGVLDALMKQVRIYDYELLDEDIHDPQPYPMHEYILDEGPSGNTIIDGTPVNTWRDRSPANNNAVQYGVTNRPTWRSADGDGNPYLEFDALDDFLETILEMGTLTDFTIFMVTQPNVDANTRAAFSIGTINSNGLEQFFNTANHRSQARGSSGNPGPVAYKVPGVSLKGYMYAQGVATVDHTAQWVQDLPATVAGAYGTINSNLAYIGSRFGTEIFYPNAIYEILLYATALDAEQIEGVQAYLAGKYKLTAP